MKLKDEAKPPCREPVTPLWAASRRTTTTPRPPRDCNILLLDLQICVVGGPSSLEKKT